MPFGKTAILLKEKQAKEKPKPPYCGSIFKVGPLFFGDLPIIIKQFLLPLANYKRKIDCFFTDCTSVSKTCPLGLKGIIRKNRYQLCYAVQLKAMQNLGYFVNIDQVHQVIINHLRRSLGLHYKIEPAYESPITLSRHRQLIRQYLGITPWGLKGDESARRVAIKASYQAAQTLNTPADIINVVIEALRIHHFELPAFSTLCRLVRHVRSSVNNALFQGIFLRLTKENKIPTF